MTMLLDVLALVFQMLTGWLSILSSLGLDGIADLLSGLGIA